VQHTLWHNFRSQSRIWTLELSTQRSKPRRNILSHICIVANDCGVRTVRQSLTSAFRCLASCDLQCNIYCIITFVLRVRLKRFNYPNIAQDLDEKQTIWVVINDCRVWTVRQMLTSVFRCFASCDSQCNTYCIITFVVKVGLKWFNYPNIAWGIDGTQILIFESSSTIAEFGWYVRVLQAFFAASLPVTNSAIYIVS
jgi:hypothetical protein